jgi:hypothetical protein
VNSLHRSLPHRALTIFAALIFSLAAAVHVYAANTITQVSPADFGSNNAMAIGADGFPVIAHVELDPDGYDDALYITKCGNADCTANNTRTFIDSAFSTYGSAASIVVSADGLPVVGYIDFQEFKVVKCGNPACSIGNTLTTLGSNENGLGYSTSASIALSPHTGLPVLAFSRYILIASAHVVIACNTPNCSSATTTNLSGVDLNYDFSLHKSSMAMGSDGFPLFSYVGRVDDGHGNTSRAIKVLKCGNVTCSSGNITSVISMPTTLPPFPQSPRLVSTQSRHWPSIAIGTDGLPVISFVTYAPLPVGESFDEKTPTALTFARCKTESCSVTASVSVVDSSGAQVGAANTISVPADGRPVVSYYDSTGKKLKVAKCGGASCSSQNTVNVVDIKVLRHFDFNSNSGFWSSMAIPADGRPIISYSDQESLTPGVVLKVLRCGDARCTP